MATTFNVRVYEIERRKNAKGKVTSYRVVWRVDGRKCHNSFAKVAQADAYRSMLMTATKNGEPFDTETGEPVSWKRAKEQEEEAKRKEVGWYTFACMFTDMKWNDVSAKHRSGIAYLLSTASLAMLPKEQLPYTDQEVRTALRRWGFNTKQREGAPAWAKEILTWVDTSCFPVTALVKPTMARALLNAATCKRDGKRAAASTCRKHLVILTSMMAYAAELELLEEDPIKALSWEPPDRVTYQVDRRSVINPYQGKKLLEAIGNRKPSGPLLKPFFAMIYYSGLRPEEAVNVFEDDLTLSDNDEEWGEIYVHEAAPDAGRDWTDSGEIRDKRGLKHRPRGDGRWVPVPPPLVAILRQHKKENGFAPDGRICYGLQGGVLATSTILRIFNHAREDVFTEAEQKSPLATRPYDLRHACLSTWLNAGVSVTQVAEWAGNSPDVLSRVYAKCLTGQGVIDRAKISTVLDDRSWEAVPGYRRSSSAAESGFSARA